MDIEVVYALPREQVVIGLQCESPITIEQAIRQSGILKRFPDIQLSDDNVGIFGYRQPLNYPVSAGDRVEIYRPLLLSPTEARKIRAAARQTREGTVMDAT